MIMTPAFARIGRKQASVVTGTAAYICTIVEIINQVGSWNRSGERRSENARLLS